MRKEKTKAIQLRHRGKSYKEIGESLDISKSTLAGWFKNDSKSIAVKHALSTRRNKNVAERIKNFTAANKLRWQKWREGARREAESDFAKLSKDRLFVAGLMLYWGEGDNKNKNPLRLSNTSPVMIGVYVKFLIKCLKIPKSRLRVGLILYPDLNQIRCINFWSKISGISPSQFYKVQVIRGFHPTRKLPNGVCMIIINDGRLKEKVLTWIDLLSIKL